MSGSSRAASGLTIAVVIPAYNAERFVGETLTSVLGQTRHADEVIVVDDGSTDATREALEPFCPQIRLITQPNAGAGGAYTRGFRAARSDYVARCDADDIWEPDKLARQAQVLAGHRCVDIAFGGAVDFGDSNRRWDPPASEGLLPTAVFSRDMYRRNLICASSAIVRRRLFERLGAFVTPHPCEDYDFWLRAVKAGARFYYHPAVVVRYRRHPDSVTGDLLGMFRATYEVHRWHADLIDDRLLVREVLADDRFRIAQWLYEHGRARVARRAFLASLRRRPAPRELGWALACSAPERYRHWVLASMYSLKRLHDDADRRH